MSRTQPPSVLRDVDDLATYTALESMLASTPHNSPEAYIVWRDSIVSRAAVAHVTTEPEVEATDDVEVVPTAVRLRRLVDSAMVVAAYDVRAVSRIETGPGICRRVPGRVPEEIVDLSDGTRLITIEIGDEEIVRRFDSEEDMWRAIHAAAESQVDHRAAWLAATVRESTIRDWSAAHTRFPSQLEELPPESTRALRDIFHEDARENMINVENVTSTGKCSARHAWVDRPVELAILPDSLPLSRQVSRPDESDDRPRDSIGRRIGKPSAANLARARAK